MEVEEPEAESVMGESTQYTVSASWKSTAELITKNIVIDSDDYALEQIYHPCYWYVCVLYPLSSPLNQRLIVSMADSAHISLFLHVSLIFISNATTNDETNSWSVSWRSSSSMYIPSCNLSLPH